MAAGAFTSLTSAPTAHASCKRGSARTRGPLVLLAALGVLARAGCAWHVGSGAPRVAVRAGGARSCSRSGVSTMRRRGGRSPALRMSALAPDDDSSAPDDGLSADLDMEVLRRRMWINGASVSAEPAGPEEDALPPWEAFDAPYPELADESALDALEAGYVLLFQPGSEEEGVYTVQDDELATFVLAFQSEEDATRFAQQLEAEDFDLPAVAAWDMDVLAEFCEEGDYKIGLVPSGVMLMPPRQNFYRDDLRVADGDSPRGAELCDVGAPLPAGAEWELSSALAGERAAHADAEVVSLLDRLFEGGDGESPFEPEP